MRVYCCEATVEPGIFTHEDGTKRFSYQCPTCRLSLVARESRWERIAFPIKAAGINEMALSTLIKADARVNR